MSYIQTQEEFLNMRIHQFLVHSFLYYKLNENLIDDHKYDEICIDLSKLRHTEGFRNHKYYNYIKGIDKSSSGFYIDIYPRPIISMAFHLLYNNVKSNDSFDRFVARYGYELVSQEYTKEINNRLFNVAALKGTTSEILTINKLGVTIYNPRTKDTMCISLDMFNEFYYIINNYWDVALKSDCVEYVTYENCKPLEEYPYWYRELVHDGIIFNQYGTDYILHDDKGEIPMSPVSYVLLSNQGDIRYIDVHDFKKMFVY